LFRPESLPLEPRPELELPRPLLLLPRPLLLPRDDPSSLLPPRSRFMSDELREEPLLPRDELPDPDDLFDWFAIGVLLKVSRMRLAAHSFRHRCAEIGSRFRDPSVSGTLACDDIQSEGIPPIRKEHIMARSKSGTTRAQPLALELLMSDHRKVEDLFEQFEQEKEGDEGTRREIAQQICNELTIHAQVEEELFYPWLRENLDDDEVDMVEEAQVEHNTAKDLIAQIEGATDIDEQYNARVKVLGEYIKHHVQEEENEIFPAVRDEQEELDELGQEMAARKGELKEEMGLPEEEEEEGEGIVAARGHGGDAERRTPHRGSR